MLLLRNRSSTINSDLMLWQTQIVALGDLWTMIGDIPHTWQQWRPKGTIFNYAWVKWTFRLSTRNMQRFRISRQLIMDITDNRIFYLGNGFDCHINTDIGWLYLLAISFYVILWQIEELALLRCVVIRRHNTKIMFSNFEKEPVFKYYWQSLALVCP